MKRLGLTLAASAVLATLVAIGAGDALALRGGAAGRGGGPLIYVASQGLYFETFVSADPLPMKGRFQQLYIGPNGPTTDAGPGDPGYLGGRWWVDQNGNGEMDEGDHFFLCPLLPPGVEL